MFTVVSTLTLSLAKAMGVYVIAAGLSGLFAPERWRAMVEGFRTNIALTYTTGAFVFALGAAIVMAHNRWTDILSDIVSLIGWLAAVEGIALILFPGPLLDFSTAMAKPGPARIAAIVAILLGAFLLIGGFAGRAG